MYLSDEAFEQVCIRGKLVGLRPSHEMPVVVPVAVVISQNAPVVDGTAFFVYVCQTVADHLAIFEPNLLLQKSAFSLSLEPMYLDRGF